MRRTQVIIYDFEFAASKATLTKKASYRTATAPIDVCVTGNVIAVTDLMKSMSLVEYKKGRAGMPDTLTEVSKIQRQCYSAPQMLSVRRSDCDATRLRFYFSSKL